MAVSQAVRVLCRRRSALIPVCHICFRERSTFDTQEMQKFAAVADQWWDEQGEFKPLHSLNRLRVQFIRDGLVNNKQVSVEDAAGPLPLKRLNILDVGCGGGLLTECLGRLGASVVGIDASPSNTEVAALHAKQDPELVGQIEYVTGTVEDHALQRSDHYDAVVASEVVEHVADQPYFVEVCTKLTKPGGSLFLTTLNRTWLSWALGVVAVERILSIVPPGTHDWNKFLHPQELQRLLEANGCSVKLVHGMLYNVLCNEWMWVSNTSINYALHAVRTLPAPPGNGETLSQM